MKVLFYSSILVFINTIAWIKFGQQVLIFVSLNLLVIIPVAVSIYLTTYRNTRSNYFSGQRYKIFEGLRRFF